MGAYASKTSRSLITLRLATRATTMTTNESPDKTLSSRRGFIHTVGASALALSGVDANSADAPKITLDLSRLSLKSDKRIDAGPEIRKAIAAAKQNGGGTIVLPSGFIFIAIASESDIILIDFDNLTITSPGIAKIEWQYYGLPLFAFLGSNNCTIENMNFTWSGIRKGSPATASFLGYESNGILSPPDICTHIFVGGSNNTTLRNLSWQGKSHDYNLEVGITLYNGNKSGPSRTAKCVGNVIQNISSSDVYFGLAIYGQENASITNFTSDHYKVTGLVGAGHAIYVTGHCNNITIDTVSDLGTRIPEVDTKGYTATTIQLRSVTNSVVSNITSHRTDGILSILNGCSDNVIKNIHWSSDRTADEDRLKNGNAVTIAQADDNSEISRNRFIDWILIDKINLHLGRSSNVGIIGTSGAKFSPAKSMLNTYYNISISFSPGGDYSKSVFHTFGSRNRYTVSVTNLGKFNKEIFHLQDNSSGDESSECSIKINYKGPTSPARIFSNKHRENRIITTIE